MSSRQSVIWCINGEKRVNYVCAIVYLCCDVCASVSVHIPEPACMPLGVHVCVHMCVCVFGGVPAFLASVSLLSCTWKMKVWGPMLRMKREKCLFPAAEMQIFLEGKALSTQPWRADPGHGERLNQPAVSAPSQKDLNVCFQPGRLFFSGQIFGSQTILANILS